MKAIKLLEFYLSKEEGRMWKEYLATGENCDKREEIEQALAELRQLEVNFISSKMPVLSRFNLPTFDDWEILALENYELAEKEATNYNSENLDRWNKLQEKLTDARKRLKWI